MHFSLPARFAALAVAAVAASTVTMMAPAQADESATVIRPSDFQTPLSKALSDTRASGQYEFLKNGLHVQTTDSATPTSSQNKVAEYFALDRPLSAITSASLQWAGTQPQPGQQIVFDADDITGNGNDYNVLVGEPVYHGNWWLTGGSSAAAKAADPSGVDNGGNGSDWFGTLANWSTALPHARVYAGGFSLGSGVKGDGVILGMQYGDQNFEFTNQAAAATPETRDVTGSQVTTRYGVHHNRVKVVMSSAKQPANTTEGKRLQWRVVVDGHTAFKTSQGFGDRDVFTRGFHMGTGKHTLQVTKNGAVVKNVTVRSGQ